VHIVMKKANDKGVFFHLQKCVKSNFLCLFIQLLYLYDAPVGLCIFYSSMTSTTIVLLLICVTTQWILCICMYVFRADLCGGQ